MNSEISELQEQGKQFVSRIRQAQRQFFSIPSSIWNTSTGRNSRFRELYETTLISLSTDQHYSPYAERLQRWTNRFFRPHLVPNRKPQKHDDTEHRCINHTTTHPLQSHCQPVGNQSNCP